MANRKHLAKLAKGVATWNKWRDETRAVPPDLVGATLRQRVLSCADLRLTSLIGADLRDANLRDADLREAKICDADLSYANLNYADLSYANLSGANLSHADIRETNLSGAIFDETKLADIDLSTVNGLESVGHSGPSTVGIDTIYRSGGKIPESFLRGCGVPENFITFMKSLTGAAFEFYSCFISYSTKDQDFADRVYADLQAKGVRCWFAPHDLQGGRKVHEQIDEAIRVYDKLLLILSDASMTSNWVKTEIANARARETQQKRQMLFPISLVPFENLRTWKCFDADTGIDSAREIREYFVLDFSNWKDHNSYTKAFDRLGRDLQTPRAQAEISSAL